MEPGKNSSLSKPFIALTIVLVVIPVLAQPTHGQRSWLDHPLVNWNRQSGRTPLLPQPVPQDEAADIQCRKQLRRPTSAAERALVKRGWLLYGRVYSYDLTRIVTALSSFDGMCRPTGFQAFVYWKGRYTGTLSPLPMDSRTDGVLADIRLTGVSSISADFVRYKESDALCCPSGISSVLYTLRLDSVPTLRPTKVMYRSEGETSDPGDSGPEKGAAALFGKTWSLTEIENRRVSADGPYMEFDREQKRVSGSGGCNRFSGTFEIAGSRLKLSRLISTKRACVDTEKQRLETSFLQLLGTTTRFRVQGNTLQLYAGNRLLLVFATN